MSQCKVGCAGVCRCTHKHELCLIVGEENLICVPCPKGKTGCGLDVLDSSELVISCPCCGMIVMTIVDPLDIDTCDCCQLTIDLTTYDELINMRNASCKLSYVLRITSTSGVYDDIDNKVFISGNICLDWTDLPAG